MIGPLPRGILPLQGGPLSLLVIGDPKRIADMRFPRNLHVYASQVDFGVTSFFHLFGTFPMPPPLKMQKMGNHFSTAPLKEYPAALSAAMAECVSVWLKRELPCFDPGAARELTGESLELVEPFRVDYSGLHTFGADTRGRGVFAN